MVQQDDQMSDFDTEVKLTIYRTIAITTRPPSAAEVAVILGCSDQEVENAFARLSAQRLLVLEPGSTSHIRMAPPFSGVQTSHRVRIDDKTYFANCAWDAFGVSAALRRSADVFSTCGDCGEAIEFEIRRGKPAHRECTVHFAVPAALWWNDIIHT